MKEVLEVTRLTVDFRRAEQATQSLGKWAWTESPPRVGEIVEHDGTDFEVASVRWSTAVAHVVVVTLRQLGE
jgi:hypothetical protein